MKTGLFVLTSTWTREEHESTTPPSRYQLALNPRTENSRIKIRAHIKNDATNAQMHAAKAITINKYITVCIHIENHCYMNILYHLLSFLSPANKQLGPRSCFGFCMGDHRWDSMGHQLQLRDGSRRAYAGILKSEKCLLTWLWLAKHLHNWKAVPKKICL